MTPQAYAVCAGIGALIALAAAAIAVRAQASIRKVLRVFIDGPPDDVRPTDFGA